MKTYLALLTSALLAAATALAADRNPLMNAYLQANMSAKNDAGTPFSILDLAGLSFSDTAGIRTVTLGSTNGVKLGATGDKVGFLGATPIVRPSGDVGDALVSLGLIESPTLSGTLISGGEGTMDLSGYDITLPSDMLLQLRRGNYAELQTITLLAGEPGWTNDTHELFVGDGTLLGGHKVGLSRSAGTSFVAPISTNVPDIVLFSNTATNGSVLQVQYREGNWIPLWSAKPNTPTGVPNTFAGQGSFVSLILGVQGAATSTGTGGGGGTVAVLGKNSVITAQSGDGGASETAFNGGQGGTVGNNLAHQIQIIGGLGGSAGSGANGAPGGAAGLGFLIRGGSGGNGGTGTGAVGGDGGNTRNGSTTTSDFIWQGGSGGNGGTASSAGGGLGGRTGRFINKGGDGGSGTTTGGGIGGKGGSIFLQGGNGSDGGATGGDSGTLTMNGGYATTGVNGGRSGNITNNGNAGFAGGDIDLSAQTGYAGPSIVTVTTDPEGNLALPVGSVARNVANGTGWFKKTGTGNTGYERVITTPSNILIPRTLAFKNIAVATTGAPLDIATITLPAEFTRWHLTGTSAIAANSLIFSEAGSGNFEGATFTIKDGSGLSMSAAATGTVVASTAVSILASAATTISTSTTVVIRQNVNSANAATASFYVTIWPIP